MNHLQIIRTTAFTTIALVLAACDASHYMHETGDPSEAQQLSPAGAELDSELAEKVKSALGVGGAPAYGVEVTVTHGTVQLLGTVGSNAERDRFATIAAGVVGVRALKNLLIVDGRT